MKNKCDLTDLFSFSLKKVVFVDKNSAPNNSTLTNFLYFEQEYFGKPILIFITLKTTST